ncbi:helix-turn-helix transcriptional regulator [Actinokineospora iranica]|uniref:Regulatory protein, luxR family n=1 Tax=Actinokineospora iranica TaxID=1271860 RepID=A0A1G6MBG6_9PSEU|nr:helix-turn-helix transcriptional regulator [Actinokineospora iranica]SDC52938.1 regulatory protein, luxR family [Actinokineospora iranica]
MILVEREAALAALTEAAAESARGASRVVAVTGGLASGKSGLLAVFADQVADSGALLLTATGSRGERGIPLGAVRQLTSGLPLPAAAGFVERVLAAAETAPVVLAVDDIQHVDSASLRVLAALRDRGAQARVLLVLTEWEPRSGHELSAGADRRVRLGPLSPRGVADLLAAELGEAAAASMADACHRLSGGNPLLAHALVSDYRADPDPGGEPVVGIAFRQAVLGCLHRWGPRLLAVARALAVLDGQPLPGLIADLTGLSRATVSRMTGILAAAGLLSGGRFGHEVVRDAVRDSLSRDEATRLRLRAADLLRRRAAAPGEIARQLVAAGRVGGGWGVEVLRAAAATAIGRDHTEFAVRCLRIALPEVTGAERAAVAADLARAEWRHNPAGRACPQDVDPATAARYALWHADPVAVPALLAAVAESDPHAAAGLRLADEWIRGARLPRPQPPRGGSVALWERSAAALTPALLRGDLAEAARDAERVLHGCPLDDWTVEVLAAALTTLLHADQVDRAAHWCEELSRQAKSRRATTWVALFGAVGADIALRRGALRTARALAEESLRALPARAWGVLIGLPLATMLLADTALGAHDSAALREVAPDAMVDTLIGVRYLRARGHHYLATDRVLAAVADFQACGRFLTRHGIDLPALAPWRTDLAEAHIRLGGRRVAGNLARRQLDLPASASRHARGRSLRLLAAATDRVHGPSLLHEAAEEFRAAGDRFAVSVALAELSRQLTERGEHTRARRVAKAAADEARACGAANLVDRLLRHPTSLPPTSATTLSEAEHRVAALAALGHTNREIADRLHITVSTVEQHLTKIYRKLGVSRREDLASHPDRARNPGA